jgi:hypothetical protein
MLFDMIKEVEQKASITALVPISFALGGCRALRDRRLLQNVALWSHILLRKSSLLALTVIRYAQNARFVHMIDSL